MLKYSIRRLLGMIPMLILISIVVFSLAKLMPGDSLSGEIDPLNTNPEYIAEMREKLGYNDPLPVQYFNWVTGFIQGDFGKSTKYKRPVFDVIMEKVPNTLFLGIMSLIITYILAFLMGMYSGRKPYTLGDNAIAGINYIMLAIPSFCCSCFCYLFLCIQLKLVPVWRFSGYPG